VVSQSPEENEIPTIRVEATSPGRNANVFREAAQGYTGGPPGRLPLPAAHPFPTQLLVPWPSIEPHGSRPSFTPRRLAAARTAFVRAEIIPA
jgi:hypothetical protein